jgi:hypothetical protein
VAAPGSRREAAVGQQEEGDEEEDGLLTSLATRWCAQQQREQLEGQRQPPLQPPAGGPIALAGPAAVRAAVEGKEKEMGGEPDAREAGGMAAVAQR